MIKLTILLLLVSLCLYALVQYKILDYTIIKMEPGSRTVRIGLGQYQGNWFFRVDFWLVGIRFTYLTF